LSIRALSPSFSRVYQFILKLKLSCTNMIPPRTAFHQGEYFNKYEYYVYGLNLVSISTLSLVATSPPATTARLELYLSNTAGFRLSK